MTTTLVDRLRARLPAQLVAEEPPPFWPRFGSRLHTPAVTARLGRVLGVCFGVCFVTGMWSLYQYVPLRSLPPLATPTWGYRVTQGLHVVTGIASVPLLLVKLWSVYPRLFAWPPARSLVQGLERLSVAVLVASALVELVTGLMNILGWYPWPWSFTFVHTQLGYVVMGSLLLHIAVKLPVIREGLATPLAAAPAAAPSEDLAPPSDDLTPPSDDRPPSERDDADPAGGLSRRGLVVATAVGVGAVVVTTAGQTLTPLRGLAVLAPRRVEDGPQGVPVNRTFEEAGVDEAAVTAAAWALSVTGPSPFTLDLAALEALDAVDDELPLACVEGWSASALWRGPRLMDLVERAGGDAGSRVRVTSLQTRGAFAASTVYGAQLRGALLATHLGGARLSRDHGYPVRLIAPSRPGVFQTKWLTGVEVR